MVGDSQFKTQKNMEELMDFFFMVLGFVALTFSIGTLLLLLIRLKIGNKWWLRLPFYLLASLIICIVGAILI